MAKMMTPANKSKSKTKTKIKIYNIREVRRVIERNGWMLVRKNGDHFYYKKEGHPLILNVSVGINKFLWERIVDRYKLDLDA